MSNKIYSMTGFGRAEVQDERQKIVVEIKSVNHRYLEPSIKAPKKFSLFESKIRSLLKDYAQRGKIDVYITYEDYSQTDVTLKYNEALAGQYLEYAQKAAEAFGINNDMTVSRLFHCPDVLTQEETKIDEDALWAELEAVLRQAGEAFRTSRNKEGENLRDDLYGKLDNLEQNVAKVIEREPQIMEEYRKRLEDKTKELLEAADIDDSRIAAEVVLFSDKICKDEETVRLKSHIQNMRDTLAIGDNIGRKLDFLAQEMNREANTILSKANDLETSNIGVELKTEIEKIREQVQNVE
uniref:YicC/YloC family endoribonuclease n=1 Tax=Eubacterium cellulosolvens TaxID=29322 RepID=UPI0004837DDB|nr:YicC/YloC family endoribonuclease [[Eubacterium] cellulosolvens]